MITYQAPLRAPASSVVYRILTGAFAAAIFFVDTVVRPEMAVAVLYTAVVLLATRWCHTRGLLLVGTGCAGLAIIGFYFKPDHSLPGLVIVLISITAIWLTTYLGRKSQATEIALRERTDLLDLTHDCVFSRDLNDTITSWNRGAEGLYGWTRNEAIGKSSHQLLETVFPEPLGEITAKLWRTGRWEGELIHKRRNETQVTVSSRWSVQRDRQGRPITILETNNDITERKRAEEALRERETKIRRLIDSDIIGIFFWDFNGAILDANDAFLGLMGYDRDDLTAGRISWTDLTPPNWLEQDARMMLEHRRTGRLPPLEKEYFRKDGSRIPVLVGAATFEEGGNQGVAFVLDLTERKRAEEAARRSERALRDVIDTIPAMTWTNLPDGANDFTNHNWLEFTGMSPSDVAGARWMASFHPADIAAHLEKWRVCLATGEPFENEARILRAKDGEFRWFLHRAVPLRDENDSILKWYGISTDIDDRKRAEAALRESEEQWKAVFENNPTMYFMVRAGGAIASVNPFGAEQLGFTSDELIGSPVQDLFHPEDREFIERNATACFEQPGQSTSWEARKIRKNGEVLWVRETARVVPINDRAMALIVCEDITERKRVSETLREVQTELAHANRVATMGHLTASIAHEVKQPIAATVINAQAALRWLGSRPPNLAELRKALERIAKDSTRAGDVVDGIRALVQKTPLRKDRLEINAAIREIIELTHGEAVKNGISMQTQLAADLPVIQGDRVQLQQVILNLIMNAIEAIAESGREPRLLTIVTARRDSNMVSVEVRDTGPGLDAGQLDRLFHSFYTTKPHGMGMGLPICRSIVEAHDGKLTATADPRGGIFMFTLPTTSDERISSEPLPSVSQENIVTL